MNIYNTATTSVEEFRPSIKKEVKIYTCGPTVYDYQHVGNWFTYIRYDLLIRVLKAQGYSLKWIINITDVGHLVSDSDEGEDKLEKGARRERKTAKEIAKFYSADFIAGLKKLNITDPTFIPYASDNIDEQINLIKKLETAGYTYIIDDGVYFNVSKFPAYADFAHLSLKNQKSGSRVDYNSQKQNPYDFALWKFSPKTEKRDMEWPSPWGTGFPGWHIECSAMILKYLGETIDIHAGGIDHIPVHHTNEIAQSQAATGKQLANYWMHTNHILLNEIKLSKSLGNGVTLDDISSSGNEFEALRLLALESHYRTQSKFGWDLLDAAANRLKGYRAMAALKWQPVDKSDFSNDLLSTTLSEVKLALENDLGSPQALQALSGISDQLIEYNLPSSALDDFNTFLNSIDELLGLRLSSVSDIPSEVKELIISRTSARKNDDWDTADRLRKELADHGVTVRDTDHGSIWSYL